jgi:hypothetical protein
MKKLKHCSVISWDISDFWWYFKSSEFVCIYLTISRDIPNDVLRNHGWEAAV